ASLVLALALFAGLLGCAGQAQSSEVESAISSEITSGESTSSVEYVPLDRFEDENIINTECTREKLAQTVVSAKSAESEYWTIKFVSSNFQAYSPYSITATSAFNKDNPVLKFSFLNGRELHRFITETYSVRFKTLIPYEGLPLDDKGYYSFEIQLVMERCDDCTKLLGYVTSRTDQIKTPSDAVDFLSMIPAYRELQYPPKSSGQESGWFGEGSIINTVYTRMSLSENPVTSSYGYSSTILDWIDLFIIGNYNSFSSRWTTTFSEQFFTLNTITGEKEYFTTLNCVTEFKSDIEPVGLEYDDGSYEISFQMVIKTSEIYYKGPFTLIGFVTNQERQIIEPLELYDFIKDVPRYKDTDFIVPEPMKFVKLDSLGYDFTETIVDEATGLSVVNLHSLTGGLKVDDFTFFPGDLLAVLAVDPEVQNEKVLMVFNADDLQLLYQKTFSYPSGTYPAGGHAEFYKINGTLVLEQKLGNENYKYFIPEKTGVSEIPKPTERYRLSDSAFIVEEKNCLYLEQNGKQKLLLEGIDEDSVDSEGYRFIHRISDTRFIYELMGYEWLVECGIYDIETGEKTVFTHENAPLLDIEAYNDGKAILVADTWCGPEYESYGPYLYDELSGELIDLALLNIQPD
ncbi:MAG TPA: hypothetical protein P5198_08430, partial [Flexilinea sp.]|nr:hypothetical protein [Flexilinea sp.]